MDLYTIRKDRVSIDGVSIVLANDLGRSRTIHSLAKALAQFDGVTVIAAGPQGARLPEDVRARFRPPNALIECTCTEDVSLIDVVKQYDPEFLYMTRPQKERAGHPISTLCVDEQFLKEAPENLKVMHPLPIDSKYFNEITREALRDPRVICFQQSDSGIPVRMAILGLWLKGTSEAVPAL